MANFPAWWPGPADSPAPHADPGLWAQLTAALDFSQTHPCQAAGIVSKQLVDASGPHVMLKNPRTHTYARLSLEEFWLWQKMDGLNTVQQLVLAYFMQYKAFAFAATLGLVTRLRAQNMLTEPPRILYAEITTSLNKRTTGYRFSWLAREVFSREFTVKGLDGHLSRIYRYGGWLMFTVPAQILLLLVSLLGSLLFVLMTTDPRYQLLGGGIGAAMLKLGLLAYIPLVIHEFGHAITAKHFGCEVHHGGIQLYFGLPAVFVETTDIWMQGKKGRLAVTWGGPYTGYIIGGTLSTLVYFLKDLSIPTATLMLQVAMMSFFVNTYNLLPVLKLDGYYLLADALEIPRLRERSIEFVTSSLRPKLLKRERWTREEVIFLAFGILAIVTTIYFTYGSISFWDTQASQSIAQLLHWNGDIFGQIFNAFIVILAVSTIAYAIHAMLLQGPQLVAWLRKKGLLSTAGRAALVVVAGALLISLLPVVLLPSFAAWILGIGAILAFAFSIWMAVNAFINMRGSIHAAMWLLVASGLTSGLLSIVAGAAGLSNVVTIVLGALSLVLCGLSAIPAGRLLSGMLGSWRATSMVLFVTGLVVWAISLAARSFIPVELVQAVSGLLLAGSFLHWNMRPAVVPATPAPTAQAGTGTTRARIVEAFNHIKAAILAEVEADYGRKTRQQVENGSYRTARTFMQKKPAMSGETQFSSTKTGMTPDDYGGAIALLLDELLAGVQNAAGKKYTHRALAYGFDRLDWELQELAEDYLLQYIPDATGLTSRLASARSAREDILPLVRSAAIFMSLTEEEILEISQLSRFQRYNRGDLIIRQGEPGDAFYLIRLGKVEIVYRDAAGEHILNQLARGDYFGESALLTGDLRNASVRALLPAELLVLKREDFDRLLRKNFSLQGKVKANLLRLRLLRQVPLFAGFEGFELSLVAGKLQSVTATVGQPIFNYGDQGDKFYLIESGKVSVQIPAADGEKQLVERALLGPGEYFGEIALLMNTPRTATIIPVQPTVLLSLDAQDFIEIVTESKGMKDALERASSRRQLSNERWARDLLRNSQSV